MNIQNASNFLKKYKLKITISFIVITSLVSIIVLCSSFVYIKSNIKKINLNFKDKLANIKKENLTKVQKKLQFNNSKPKFYLIIDDVGYDEFMLDEFIKIDLNINFSIIPFLPKSMDFYNKLASKNKIIMIHFPMQSKYKTSIEKFNININDNVFSIRTKIEKTFKTYPNAKIMNNHMGSLITANENIMQIILIKLKEENRYFFDSLTTKESISEQTGKKFGIIVEKRDIFLDNKDNEKAVAKALEQAKQVARTKGIVKVIGHIWSKNTLKILKKESENLNKEFEFQNLINLYQKEGKNESAWNRKFMR
ncbi:divergent polysaccharide deacetylase family protein [Borrelia coriaceae]|uniref:Polysaccharide deacetylase superfamily protein n=1 Tax=Borrelia coriaceae ATCC 43381 TaxID=1408429 RepID=W5SUT2_9SPIR|nr:divergent polysaccharide deacetylase family protein [Borrelia coriaceae]AHH10964.1 Polysaccharide deacetylase superfamily protein [Borrelia coriaceae ATCC 43381]UPA16612.1 divergent polysaccharide deacetylase family protein [Borrelia coriaceae]